MKKWLKIGLSLLIWLLLMYFLYRKIPSNIDWSLIKDPGRQMGLVYFGLCYLAAYALRTWRYAYLIRRSSDISWSRLVSAFPYLFFIGAMTPLRLGEAYRAVWVKKNMGDASSTLGYWLAERATDLITIFAMLFTGLYFADSVRGIQLDKVALTLLILTVSGYLMVWTMRGFLKTILLKLRFPEGLVNILDGFEYMKDTQVHAIIVINTVLTWTFMALGFALCLSAWGISSEKLIPFSLLCVALVNLAGVISVSPGNIGGFQAAMVLAATAYAVSTELIILPAIFLQLVGLGIICVLGAISYIVSSRRRNNVDHNTT